MSVNPRLRERPESRGEGMESSREFIEPWIWLRNFLAISLMQAGRVEVIAGINLPMLIRLAGARKCMAVDAAARAARDAGRNYITIASEFLGQDA